MMLSNKTVWRERHTAEFSWLIRMGDRGMERWALYDADMRQLVNPLTEREMADYLNRGFVPCDVTATVTFGESDEAESTQASPANRYPTNDCVSKSRWCDPSGRCFTLCRMQDGEHQCIYDTGDVKIWEPQIAARKLQHCNRLDQLHMTKDGVPFVGRMNVWLVDENGRISEDYVDVYRESAPGKYFDLSTVYGRPQKAFEASDAIRKKGIKR